MHRLRKHRTRWMTAVAVCILTPGSPVGAAAPVPRGTVRFALSKDITALRPFVLTRSLETDIESVHFVSLASRQKTGAYHVTPGGGIRSAPDPDLVYYDTEASGETRNNNSGFQNKKLDQLLEEGRRVGDFKKRYKIYCEALLLLQDQVPEVFLMLNPYVFGLRPQLKGFQPSTEGQFSFGLGGLPFAWLEK